MVFTYFLFSIIAIMIIALAILAIAEAKRKNVLKKVRRETRPLLEASDKEVKTAVKIMRKLQSYPYYQVKEEVEDFLKGYNLEDQY